LFPERHLNNDTWVNELQKPIDVKITEIKEDLSKFVKDFPIETIPHMTSDEYIASNRFIKSNIDKIS